MGTKYTRGFTLIELLVVISIVSVFSAIVLSAVNSARLRADDVKRISDLKAIEVALNLYFSENGSYPATAGSTCSGDWPAAFKTALIPKYISSLPLDPKNDIRSCGPTIYNYYYGFYNAFPTSWGWGTECAISILPRPIILYSVGSPTTKTFQNACKTGAGSRINTVIFKQ